METNLRIGICEHFGEDYTATLQGLGCVFGGLGAEDGVCGIGEVVKGFFEKAAVLGESPHRVDFGELIRGG